jgi:hypothetical protein
MSSVEDIQSSLSKYCWSTSTHNSTIPALNKYATISQNIAVKFRKNFLKEYLNH